MIALSTMTTDDNDDKRSTESRFTPVRSAGCSATRWSSAGSCQIRPPASPPPPTYDDGVAAAVSFFSLSASFLSFRSRSPSRSARGRIRSSACGRAEMPLGSSISTASATDGGECVSSERESVARAIDGSEDDELVVIAVDESEDNDPSVRAVDGSEDDEPSAMARGSSEEGEEESARWSAEEEGSGRGGMDDRPRSR